MIFVKPNARKFAESRPRLRKPFSEIWESDPCSYCGSKAECIDRVRPWSKGGNDDATNLVPACKQCRNEKGSKLLNEWLPERIAYGIANSPNVAIEYARLTKVSRPNERKY